MSEREDKIGNYIAHKIWVWLQEKKRIEYVPWVVNERSAGYDPVKKEIQKAKKQLLDELETIMRN